MTPEQGRQLRGIGIAFIAEVRAAHGPALRQAVVSFLQTVKATLTDDQKGRAKATAARVRGLPPARKFEVGWTILRSMDLQALRGNLAAWFGAADSASRTAAGERIAWQVAKAVCGRVKDELGLDEGQIATLRTAFTKLLDDTRASRVAIDGIAKAKLDEAMGILTPEQKARIETLKEALLNRLGPAEQ
ncbi:MAG: hypothetical protein JXP34_15380 [Planctomycetes bacterium]|nr:hypothetical protein [Planctomycetota bacterium]